MAGDLLGVPMSSKLSVLVAITWLTFFAAAPAQSGQQGASAELQSLAKLFAGTWTLRVTFEPTPEIPKGLHGTGEETWRAVAGGLTLTDEESITAGPIKMALLGLFWTDHVTGQLRALDCNNQNPHTCDLEDARGALTVHWDGHELVVEEPEAGPDGKPMTSRVVWSDITTSSFTETGYLGPPGGPFKKGMTLLGTRK